MRQYAHPTHRYKITTSVELEELDDLGQSILQEVAPEGLKEFTVTLGDHDRAAITFITYTDDMSDAITDPFAVIEWLGEYAMQLFWYTIEDTQQANKVVANYTQMKR